MTTDLASLSTSTQAADALGISTTQVKYLAQKHGIGYKLGNRWVFTPEQIDHLRQVREQCYPGYAGFRKKEH